jgi:NAD(P)H-hydrate epimerase
MGAIDRAAPEPVEVLVARAGAAVAWAARRRLGGTYGKRIVVLAGKGNNGADGRVAGARLAAVETVTFQALKPGLLLPPGAGLVGDVSVADIGLDVSSARAHLVEQSDVVGWLPTRSIDAHKWQSACWVIAGSASMTGAARLAAAAAQRAGSGYVRLSIPGSQVPGPVETVAHHLPVEGWERGLSTDLERFGSVVLGPGLGRGSSTRTSVRAALTAMDVPVVLDGDGLAAVGRAPDLLVHRAEPTVLTPHEREFEFLMGRRPGPDRLAEARAAAVALDSIVLLKGSATVVAEPGGRCLVVNAGDDRLATAGTGDVLAGVVGGLIAAGVGAFEAAAAAAWLHGESGRRRSRHGLIASDLIDALPEVLDATHLG